MFINELEYFMKSIKNKDSNISPSIDEGIQSLKLALKMKEKLA